MSALDRAKRWLKDILARAIILFVGLAPVSCHYQITAPALWAHQSSYAFEAWLVMWIAAIAIACGAIYVSVIE